MKICTASLQSQKRVDRRRGQTAVEYLLLMGAVVFVVVALKDLVLDGMFASVLPEMVASSRGEAATGGQRRGYYYVDSVSVPQEP